MTSPKITALTAAMAVIEEDKSPSDDKIHDWYYMKNAKYELLRLLNGGLEPNRRLIDEAMKRASVYLAQTV